jgi:hypothetical protein
MEADYFGVRGKFALYYHIVDEGIYFKLIGRPLDFFLTNEGVIQVDCGEISNTPFFRNISDEEGIDAINTTVEFLAKTFTAIQLYIEQVRDNAEVVEIQKERKPIIKKARAKSGASGKPRKIYISRKKYVVKYDDPVEKRGSRSYQRRTESWVVSGHKRHYKSGLVIYINPYVKGSGAKTPKTYVLNDQINEHVSDSKE